MVGGVNALKNAPALATTAKPVVDRIRPLLEKAAPQVKIPEDTVTLVRINAARRSSPPQRSPADALRASPARCWPPRWCRPPWPVTSSGTRATPRRRANQRIHFFKNLSMLGGLLLASVDTEGRPGVAWRAKNAATGARRQGKHLRREAKLQARLAAKSLGQ